VSLTSSYGQAMTDVTRMLCLASPDVDERREHGSRAQPLALSEGLGGGGVGAASINDWMIGVAWYHFPMDSTRVD
jgi:hypothetical protein